MNRVDRGVGDEASGFYRGTASVTPLPFSIYLSLSLSLLLTGKLTLCRHTSWRRGRSHILVRRRRGRRRCSWLSAHKVGTAVGPVYPPGLPIPPRPPSSRRTLTNLWGRTRTDSKIDIYIIQIRGNTQSSLQVKSGHTYTLIPIRFLPMYLKM